MKQEEKKKPLVSAVVGIVFNFYPPFAKMDKAFTYTCHIWIEKKDQEKVIGGIGPTFCPLARLIG